MADQNSKIPSSELDTSVATRSPYKAPLTNNPLTLSTWSGVLVSFLDSHLMIQRAHRKSTGPHHGY
jgi:hypothetical protein